MNNPQNNNNAQSDTPRDLFGQFARAEWLLHRYHQHNHRMHGPMGDPHRGQGRVLALLKLQPEISQRELSFLLDMRPQSLGELLAKLERSGFITRETSEADRRAVNVRLTDEGREAAAAPPDREDIFSCLSEQERSALGGYLERIIAHLEQQLGDEAPEGEERWRGGEHGFPHDVRFGPGHGGFDPRGMNPEKLHVMMERMRDAAQGCGKGGRGRGCGGGHGGRCGDRDPEK